MNNKSLIFWIIGGAVAGVIVIVLALSNGIIAPFGSTGSTSQNVKSSNPAPVGVSYDQNQTRSTSTNAAATVVTGRPEAPAASVAIPVSKIPDSAVKISVARYAFNPSTFTVNAGQTVVLSLTSADNFNHSFVFIDPLLYSAHVGVAAGETRVITFIAPAVPGNYKFQCNTFGDAARGETGTMIVK